jgi:hypothetical protein
MLHTLPISSSSTWSINCSWREVQVMKLFVKQLSSTSCHFISPWSKYSPQHRFQTSSICSLLNVRDQLSSLSDEPSSWNCLQLYCHNSKNLTSTKNHQLNNYIQNFHQATSVSVEDSVGLLTVSAVYPLPKYTVKQELTIP